MAVAAPAMTATFHLAAFPLIRTTLTTRTIRGGAKVGDEGGNRRVGPGDRGDLVEDPVEVAMEQGATAGMEVQGGSDLCTKS